MVNPCFVLMIAIYAIGGSAGLKRSVSRSESINIPSNGTLKAEPTLPDDESTNETSDVDGDDENSSENKEETSDVAAPPLVFGNITFNHTRNDADTGSIFLIGPLFKGLFKFAGSFTYNKHGEETPSESNEVQENQSPNVEDQTNGSASGSLVPFPRPVG